MNALCSRLSFCLFALTVHGCGADVGAVDTRVDPILNGTSAPDGERGMVRIDSAASTCAGVALRNDWVVTSYWDGCVSEAQILSPTTIRVRVGTQVVTADAALVYDAGSYNAVMLHLSSPLSLNGSTTGFRQDIDDRPLSGAVVTCYGYGNSTTTGGAGTLRKAAFVANQVNPPRFTIGTNAAGQRLLPGDGGSACFNGTAVAGVSFASLPNATAPSPLCEFSTGAEFRRWSLSVMESSGPRTNDTRATALTLGWYAMHESTVWGSTIGATHDGPTVACGCTSGPDVWYRFNVAPGGAVHYFDTAGSSFDTSLLITDASGNPVAGNAVNPNAGLCSDDVTCPAGDFTSTLQSSTAAFLPAGTYYVVVGGCGQGRFVLHHQFTNWTKAQSVSEQAAVPVAAQLTGNGTWTATNPGGIGESGMAACNAIGAESMRWFVSCGGAQQFFSLCRSDAGGYTRRANGIDFDPVLRLRSARTFAEVSCNDDGISEGATDCIGIGGNAAQYGSRLNNVVVPRGLNMVYVDERTGNGARTANGMSFTLRHIVR